MVKMMKRSLRYVCVVSLILSAFLSAGDDAGQDQDRIINGVPCKDTKFETNYIVKLTTPMTESKSLCSGTLINSLTVLTATHCMIMGKFTTVDVLPDTLRSFRINISFPVTEFTDNIVMLKLQWRVSTSLVDSYPRLPSGSNPTDIRERCDEVWVAGWGKTSTKPVQYPYMLMCVKLPIYTYLATRKCIEVVKPAEHTARVTTPDNWFCGYPGDERSACLGDGGGGAFCTRSKILIGVQGYVSQNCSRYTFFSRIDRQLDLMQKLKSDGSRIKLGFPILIGVVMLVQTM